jgi:riboflavin biosynthesis pyrimidine reductase
MAQLAGRGLTRVLCEGGPSWLGELVLAGQLDELCLTISPMMGGDPLPVAVFPPGAALTGFKLHQVLREEDSLFLRYERRRDG